MDDLSTALWRELPFPDALSDEPAEPEEGASPAVPMEDKGGQGPSRWIEHFTYRDYQLLPCTYVVRPADMLDAYSSLDSHSDYQGFLVRT